MFFRSLLPPSVYVAEMNPVLAGSMPLFPAESSLILGASEQRRLEFTAGRHLARQLLKQMCIRTQPILSCPARAPIWPDGIIGSITHCKWLCAVALVRQSEARGIGIDVERAVKLTTEAESLLLTAIDKASIKELDEPYQSKGACLAFSAKESVYKALYPIIQEFIEFTDMSIIFDITGHFRVVPSLKFARLTDYTIVGYYGVEGDYVVTAALVL